MRLLVALLLIYGFSLQLVRAEVGCAETAREEPSLAQVQEALQAIAAVQELPAIGVTVLSNDKEWLTADFPKIQEQLAKHDEIMSKAFARPTKVTFFIDVDPQSTSGFDGHASY